MQPSPYNSPRQKPLLSPNIMNGFKDVIKKVITSRLFANQSEDKIL